MKKISIGLLILLCISLIGCNDSSQCNVEAGLNSQNVNSEISSSERSISLKYKDEIMEYNISKITNDSYDTTYYLGKDKFLCGKENDNGFRDYYIINAATKDIIKEIKNNKNGELKLYYKDGFSFINYIYDPIDNFFNFEYENFDNDGNYINAFNSSEDFNYLEYDLDFINHPYYNHFLMINNGYMVITDDSDVYLKNLKTSNTKKIYDGNPDGFTTPRGVHIPSLYCVLPVDENRIYIHYTTEEGNNCIDRNVFYYIHEDRYEEIKDCQLYNIIGKIGNNILSIDDKNIYLSEIKENIIGPAKKVYTNKNEIKSYVLSNNGKFFVTSHYMPDQKLKINIFNTENMELIHQTILDVSDKTNHILCEKLRVMDKGEVIITFACKDDVSNYIFVISVEDN